MSHKRFAAMLSMTSVCVISTAHADYLYSHYMGQYVSCNAGVTYANKIFDDSLAKRGFLGAGGNLFLGDQMNAYFAPEVGVGYFSFGSNGGLTMFGLTGRFTLPVGNRIALFSKLGAAYTEVITRLTTRVQKHSFLLALGLGVGYGVTQKTMVTIEANGVCASQLQSLGNANGLLGGLTLGITHYW